MPSDRHRIFIASQPKAGTYLLAQIIKKLGYHHTHLHMGENFVDPYDPGNLKDSLRNYLAFRVKVPLNESIKLIRPGELAVGHIPYKKRFKKVFRGLKVIYVRRELRAALVSQFKFEISSCRNNSLCLADLIKPKDALLRFMQMRGKSAIKRAVTMASWLGIDDALSLRYEDILEGSVNAIDMIYIYLNIEADRDYKSIQIDSTSDDTLTKSESSLNFNDIWSEEAEVMFENLNGNAANKLLGYE